MECPEHTEPGFLQDEVSPASCIALWFDDKLKGHAVGSGEGTSTSSCPKGALGRSGTTARARPGEAASPSGLCDSCSPPLWETSPVSKRLSKQNHFWQPLGNGRSLLTAPVLASVMAVTVLSRRHPVVSPPAKIHLAVQHRGRPVQLWVFLCKAARGAVPHLPASLLAQDIGNLGFAETPARAVLRRGSSRSPTESACGDGVPRPWLAERGRGPGCDPVSAGVPQLGVPEHGGRRGGPARLRGPGRAQTPPGLAPLSPGSVPMQEGPRGTGQGAGSVPGRRQRAAGLRCGRPGGGPGGAGGSGGGGGPGRAPLKGGTGGAEEAQRAGQDGTGRWDLLSLQVSCVCPSPPWRGHPGGALGTAAAVLGGGSPR